MPLRWEPVLLHHRGADLRLFRALRGGASFSISLGCLRLAHDGLPACSQAAHPTDLSLKRWLPPGEACGDGSGQVPKDSVRLLFCRVRIPLPPAPLDISVRPSETRILIAVCVRAAGPQFRIPALPD